MNLTARQREVLRLALDGSRTEEEIGRELGIAGSTARTHLEQVRRKLGARNRAELTYVWLTQVRLPRLLRDRGCGD